MTANERWDSQCHNWELFAWAATIFQGAGSSCARWVGALIFAVALGAMPAVFAETGKDYTYSIGDGKATMIKPYGVFLGINGNEYDKLKEYRLVVIEPSEFTSEQIKQLHAEGKKVYGYLNIGAVEEYRPYFNRFKKLFLGVYEDWPDERWINAAAPAWQNFIVNELGRQYSDMGFDGFFLDNADVYYNFKTEAIYQGLCAILQGLKNYNMKLVINGGDTFVTRCINENKYLFDAVNQETVFTSINFETGTYGAQTAEETTYFKEYLAKVKNSGLSVYLLEYAADHTLSKKIDAYCTENAFIWYNAKNMDLK
jgi:uncharacterized protein (TIGR01370 family)